MKSRSCRRSAAVARPCRSHRAGRRLLSSSTAAHGTLAYLAAWDVHHARLFDRVEAKTGIEPFARLVAQVMESEPYTSARTVYWIVDNGSSHAGQASIDRLEDLRQPAADPPADPRLLAESDRAVLLDRATQSAHTQRFRLPRGALRTAALLRRPLPADRPAVRVDVHPRRPRPPARKDRGSRIPTSACGMTTELADASTSPSVVSLLEASSASSASRSSASTRRSSASRSTMRRWRRTARIVGLAAGAGCAGCLGARGSARPRSICVYRRPSFGRPWLGWGQGVAAGGRAGVNPPVSEVAKCLR